MGGGVSLMQGVEELVTTTILIGRAISAMTFPGMFRLYDFHSNKAPRLKNARSFTFFAPDSDEEDEDEEFCPDPSAYSHFFKVTVNGDDIYIEDPLEPNSSGWTPLHTCCMSLSTVNAGLALIDETLRRGGSFETKTIAGPGTFNRGWTSLQMASAYGIDPLVAKLVECGADVNATNSFGFSCILEACHRGFADIVRSLLKGPVDLSYIPNQKEAAESPFASAPCQSALGEAGRCGFYKIVQMLIDAGSPKDLQNYLGWTALHEACFYHRVETVKTLLLAGADPTIRTNQGALPYHLAGLNEIRSMLESMGGPAAVPASNDTIDMVQVLTELTMSDGDYEESSVQSSSKQPMIITGSAQMPVMVITPFSQAFSNSNSNPSSSITEVSEIKETAFSEPRKEREVKQSRGSQQDEYLHSGPMLGNLPSLTPSKSSPSKNQQSDLDVALSLDKRATGTLLGSPTDRPTKTPSKKADDKSKKPKKIKDTAPPDMPKEFLCQLTQKPMSEPMKTVYGNVYDKTAIYDWFQTQGRICPLTGAPLAEIDMSPMPDLQNEIRSWLLKKSLETENASESDGRSPIKDNLKDNRNETKRNNDDLYDF